MTDILGYAINRTVNYTEIEGLNEFLGKFNRKWQQTFLGVNMNIFNVKNTHERFA